MYHPSKNTEEIESLVVRPHKLFKNPTLYIKTRTNEEDISCKKCLANLFEKYKETTYDQNLLRAMRGSIFNGKRQMYTFYIVGKNTTMKLLHIGRCARAVTRDLGIMGINNPCIF